MTSMLLPKSGKAFGPTKAGRHVSPSSRQQLPRVRSPAGGSARARSRDVAATSGAPREPASTAAWQRSTATVQGSASGVATKDSVQGDIARTGWRRSMTARERRGRALRGPSARRQFRVDRGPDDRVCDFDSSGRRISRPDEGVGGGCHHRLYSRTESAATTEASFAFPRTVIEPATARASWDEIRPESLLHDRAADAGSDLQRVWRPQPRPALFLPRRCSSTGSPEEERVALRGLQGGRCEPGTSRAPRRTYPSAAG